MAQVPVVGRTIDTGDLGRTLMHEHVFVLTPEIQDNYDTPWGDEESRVTDAIKRLNDLKSAGIDTIVDLTVLGLGRDIGRVREVAERTEMNIIAATGFYTFNEIPCLRDVLFDHANQLVDSLRLEGEPSLECLESAREIDAAIRERQSASNYAARRRSQITRGRCIRRLVHFRVTHQNARAFERQVGPLVQIEAE